MAQLESLKDAPLIRDRIYDMLRSEILSGGFAPGDDLNILSISKQLGVSCAPVREALNMLNKDGLVDLTPYKTASVAVGTEEDYKTAFDLRLILEPYALRQSIDLISDEEIAATEEKLQQDYEQVHSVPDFYACDNEFHHMLYQHTNSKLLISTLDNVRAYTMRYYGRRFDVVLDAKKKLYQDSLFDPKRTIRDEIKEHMVILETVKKRDGDLAAALLKEHISFTASEVDAQAELTQAQNTVIPRKSTQVI